MHAFLFFNKRLKCEKERENTNATARKQQEQYA
jgi:hypothetical protein